jgi:spore germination protein KC
MDKGKKLISLFLCCFSLVLLAGCWNYRGLNEMTIVSGIAVDRNPENGNFHLTFETIDMSIPVKEKGLTPRIIEAEGKTLFDAARGAKRRNDDKLYFGNTQVIIVSELIAKEDGLHSVIDWFMRDGEGRETLTFAISQEKNARDRFTGSFQQTKRLPPPPTIRSFIRYTTLCTATGRTSLCRLCTTQIMITSPHPN